MKLKQTQIQQSLMWTKPDQNPLLQSWATYRTCCMHGQMREWSDGCKIWRMVWVRAIMFLQQNCFSVFYRMTVLTTSRPAFDMLNTNLPPFVPLAHFHPEKCSPTRWRMTACRDSFLADWQMEWFLNVLYVLELQCVDQLVKDGMSAYGYVLRK